ncbi:alpha/beta hydrolase [Nocardiopsis sp. CNR-923]|uniref:alpha/beta hydrolase n=1 Tax=Nocardiopsis sp. CNR-923 TaxID=1904965 RepID=UPI0009FA2C3E|nr:alpha/beta hydrolase [Nocardiopsis sp. CNR-923]
MDQADQVKKDLRDGPGQETVDRLVEAGHVGWNHVGLFFPVSDVPVEEFSESASPSSVSSWWESLTEDERQEAMEEHPDELRNLNGIPVTVRDELNRTALREHMELTGELDPAGTILYWEDVREALEADDKFLIHFDPLAGEGEGEVAISTGNPDTADNVSTLVPGMLTHAGTLGLSIERSETIQGQMNDHAPGADNASIMWFGYDPPLPGDVSADEAGRSLAEFQAGLRATHQGDEPSHNSVLGHSFGSFVVGAADNPDIGGGLDADSMVLVGGAGASVDNISELSMDPEDIHVVAGDDDWINGARDLGLDGHFGAPLHSEEFFADPDNPSEALGNRLDPNEGTGHSGYFEDEQTLDYLGDLMTGN